MSARTFERPHRTAGVKLYNWFGAKLRRRGLRKRLTVDAVLRSATRKAHGLKDFGDDRFLEALQVLLEAFENEARLNPFGRVLLKGGLSHFVANRARVVAESRQHPEAAKLPVRRPLFVLGMPRTGTTLLYNLLCQDSQSRPLMTWETFYPSPTPDAGRRDPRLWKVRLAVKFINRLAPQLPAVHEVEADGAEECTWLMANTFVSPAFGLQGHIPSYMQWYREQPLERLVDAYELYRLQLQLLQRNRPQQHWVLKSPAHLPAIEALLNVFDDACVVQMHRDPAKVVPSTCSLFAVTRGLYSDHVDPHVVGDDMVEMLSEFLRRAERAREKHPQRVLDVDFNDLVKHPLETVQRIYEHFAYPYDEQMETRMRGWLADHPQHKRGVHRYDLEQFGLTPQRIDESFADYRQRFELHANAEPEAGVNLLG